MNRHAKAPSTRSALAAGRTAAPGRKPRGLFGMVCLCVLALSAFAGSGAPAAGAEPACPNEALRAEQHSSGLPDCRAWEMVSPPDKNGGDTLIASSRVRVATDGSAAAFSSLSSFAGTLGSGLIGEYASTRTGVGQGWATHGTFPHQAPLPSIATLFGLPPDYVGDFAPDLSKAVFYAWKPLSDDANVAAVSNLYLRTDLKTPGDGNYSLVSACPACTSPFSPIYLFLARPIFVDATPDFEHLLFESALPLTADAPSSGGPKLYEWSSGSVSLVGILPDDTPAESSAAGAGDASNGNYTPHVFSSDGSKIFFTDGAGDLYMRVNGSSTVKLNQSEPTPGVAAPAKFWDASTDGTRIFFTSKADLTGDADGTRKLYMYDASRPDSDPDNLTFISRDASVGGTGTDVQGVIGASADGSTVYFITNSQIVPGAPPVADKAIFVWHDGAVDFVSPLGNLDREYLTNEASVGLIPKKARVSASGDLLFAAHFPVGPTGYDQGSCTGSGCQELYLYTQATHQLSCASCDPSGQPGMGDAEVNIHVLASVMGLSRHLSHALSDDGRRVFFSTTDSLVPEDTNGESDAYEYDAPSGTVHLISQGSGPSGSYFVEATPSGDDAFFMTRDRLVGWDKDHSFDLYDARIGGGFPEPPPVTAPCEGEACRPASPSQPSPRAATSEAVQGAGNPPSSRRCPKGKRRVKLPGGKTRCVRKHGKRANANRRTSR